MSSTITQIKRHDRSVFVKGRHSNPLGNQDDFTITGYEMPAASFDKALQALAPLVIKVMEQDKDWSSGLIVSGLTIKETKAGTRSASLQFRKQFDQTGETKGYSTPFFRVDDPQDQEAGERECTLAETKKIEKALTEGDKYADCQRSEMMLDEFFKNQQASQREEGEIV